MSQVGPYAPCPCCLSEGRVHTSSYHYDIEGGDRIYCSRHGRVSQSLEDRLLRVAEILRDGFFAKGQFDHLDAWEKDGLFDRFFITFHGPLRFCGCCQPDFVEIEVPGSLLRCCDDDIQSHIQQCKEAGNVPQEVLRLALPKQLEAKT